MKSVIEKSKPVERDGLYFFSDNIFDVLLGSVPIDFQRPAARRGAWNIIGGFDEGSLFSESDWAIRSAAICTIALAKNPLTEWRIHGSNFGWPAELDADQATRRQIENGIISGSNLLKRFEKVDASWSIRTDALRRSQSDLLFSKAYYLRKRQWRSGAAALWQSFCIKPRVKHLKLAAKYVLIFL